MAKRAIYRAFYRGLTFPLTIFSLIAEYMGLWGISEDLERCSKVISEANQHISTNFLDALIAAEDRRNSYHCGVDPIGMLRALFVWVARRDVQGASTIEQQFVRVVTGRYEKSIKRKIREQLLALSISRHFSKETVAYSYLAIACYGSGLVGIIGMRSLCVESLENAGIEDAIQIVSRLKYPEPISNQLVWRKKYYARVAYLSRLLGRQVTSASSSLATLAGPA